MYGGYKILSVNYNVERLIINRCSSHCVESDCVVWALIPFKIPEARIDVPPRYLFLTPYQHRASECGTEHNSGPALTCMMVK
jgi:hypothetical protein